MRDEEVIVEKKSKRENWRKKSTDLPGKEWWNDKGGNAGAASSQRPHDFSVQGVGVTEVGEALHETTVATHQPHASVHKHGQIG